jgi:hypothetical protein
MAKQRRRINQGAKAKRGFAVLDREEALKSAAVAVGLLRHLSKFAPSLAAWRCGLGYALELVEGEVNNILRFSGAGRLPDDLFGEPQRVPIELGDIRKSAKKAVDALRQILQDARADLSVDESQCNRLDNALDRLEEELNRLLPPPGAPPKAKLPAEWFGDDAEGGATATDSDSGGEMKK